MISEKIKNNIKKMSQYELDANLIHYCKNGDLDVVRYLLISPELKEHADIHNKDDWVLYYACNYGYLDIVKYLLTSSELKEHADIKSLAYRSLKVACCKGHIDIIKYLLTSPELKENVNIHVDNDSIFIYICNQYYIEILQYLIFDYNIEKTEDIKNYLDSNLKKDIVHMFEKREWEKKLKKDLKINDKKNILIKI